MDYRTLRVGDVNQYIKKILAGDWILSNISVEGEISNYKHHYSGHMYFSLKDERGKLKCVMFKNDNYMLRFQPRDGISVVATGYISVYEKEGEYQLYVKSMEESGLGILFQAFEKLKQQLSEEGLFALEHKKKLPALPNRIGVVTSATGAAIRDIITVIKRRYPLADVLIYPVAVQGAQAPREISEGLQYLDDRGDVDVIITGRGGGSIEELFAFNDESVARTIYNMKIPVVSAVGHETDFTIADFVADLRAATPSAAAELVTPLLSEMLIYLNQILIRLRNSFYNIVNNNNKKLDYIKRDLDYNSPIQQLKSKSQYQDSLFKKLNHLMIMKLESNINRINNLSNSLNYLNPFSSLDRGYGAIMDDKGSMIASVGDVSIDDKLRLLLKDGIINVAVVNISKGEFYHEG